jgi:hypothetical protein
MARTNVIGLPSLTCSFHVQNLANQSGSVGAMWIFGPVAANGTGKLGVIAAAILSLACALA